MSSTVFQQLLLATLVAVIFLFAYAARALINVWITYLKSKVGQTEYERLASFAATAVKSFEQSPVYKDLAGEKKKELVKLAVLNFAKDHNLPIDDALFDKMIEAAVQEMNSQIAQIDWSVAGTLEPEYKE